MKISKVILRKQLNNVVAKTQVQTVNESQKPSVKKVLEKIKKR